MSGEFYHIINKTRKARAGVEKEKVVEEIGFRTVKMLVGLWSQGATGDFFLTNQRDTLWTNFIL